MCGACIDLILYSTSCFKVNAQDIHFEKIPVSMSIKLPSIQKKYGQLSKVGPVYYISGLQRQILCHCRTGSPLARTNLSPFARCALGLGRHFY